MISDVGKDCVRWDIEQRVHRRGGLVLIIKDDENIWESPRSIAATLPTTKWHHLLFKPFVLTRIKTDFYTYSHKIWTMGHRPLPLSAVISPAFSRRWTCLWRALAPRPNFEHSPGRIWIQAVVPRMPDLNCGRRVRFVIIAENSGGRNRTKAP